MDYKKIAYQADGLDHWAACLEAHEPEKSAAGIIMLQKAAKTIRELVKQCQRKEDSTFEDKLALDD